MISEMKSYKDMPKSYRNDPCAPLAERMYSSEEVDDLIEDYVCDKGSNILLKEPKYGMGDHILTGAGHFTIAIWEVQVDPRTVGHILRFYQRGHEPEPIKEIIAGMDASAIGRGSNPGYRGWDSEIWADKIWLETGEKVEIPSFNDPIMQNRW